tara:strand:- start:1545 stop:1886 length:342 start_codon:yes stop_codon:yes gene_type:complete
MDLTDNDYKKIVLFYYEKKPKNITYKKLAEEILAKKLCKCIKKVQTPKLPEKSAIAICRKSIFENRNIDFFTFKCKNGNALKKKKGSNKTLKKFRRKIGFKKSMKNSSNSKKK